MFIKNPLFLVIGNVFLRVLNKYLEDCFSFFYLANRKQAGNIIWLR